jgi:hypothetical protein
MSTFCVIFDDLASNWKAIAILGIVIDIGRHRVVERP